jgi:serine-type D-Ala-D-Ala carboxypeptidase
VRRAGPLLLLVTATVALAPAATVTPDALRIVAPESVGMSTARLRDIDRAILQGLGAGGYPGAIVVVGRREGVVWRRGFGRMTWSMLSAPVTPMETMYDIASLTKVVATAMAAMILWDAGRLRLEAPVSRYLPSFRGEGREHVRVEQLLTHRSGLPAAPTLGGGTTPASARRALLTTPAHA